MTDPLLVPQDRRGIHARGAQGGDERCEHGDRRQEHRDTGEHPGIERIHLVEER